MATRSRIAIENQDGSVTSIYCHWDGYPSGVGKTLEKWYTTQAKVEALIELGDISSLDMTPTSTVAYHRDQGEDLVQSKYNRVEALFDMGFNSGAEYIYCFTKDGIWSVCEYSSNPPQVLSEVLEEESLIKQFEEDDFNKRDTGF
jgi:hypothetical protein